MQDTSMEGGRGREKEEAVPVPDEKDLMSEFEEEEEEEVCC